MQPTYSITIDPARSLLRMAVSGFFDRPTVERLVLDRNAAVDRLGCGRNRHVTLCDLTQHELSSPEIVAEFRAMVGDPRYASRRLAFIIAGALARLQIRRIAERADVGYFTSIAEAEAWLFEP
jgi:hypothetical protein